MSDLRSPESMRAYPKVKGAIRPVLPSSRGMSQHSQPGQPGQPGEADEFFLGDSKGGYLLEIDPYLWIVRGSSGLITLDEMINEVARAHGLAKDFLLNAFHHLLDCGLMELLPEPAPLANFQQLGARQRNINQHEINTRERLAIERSLISYRCDDGGSAEWEARSGIAISIVGDNRIARNLLPLLIASGFTKSSITISPRDLHSLGARDINGLSVTLEHLGRSRALHHRELIRHARILGKREDDLTARSQTADLIIATSPPPPDLFQSWQSQGIRHLAVTAPMRDEIEISHIVDPGRTPCLRCVALHRRDALPDYLAQLAHLSTGSLTSEGGEIPAPSAALVAAIITSAISNELFNALTSPPSDQRALQADQSRSLRLNLLEPTRDLARQIWNFHPECGCVDARRRALPR